MISNGSTLIFASLSLIFKLDSSSSRRFTNLIPKTCWGTLRIPVQRSPFVSKNRKIKLSSSSAFLNLSQPNYLVLIYGDYFPLLLKNKELGTHPQPIAIFSKYDIPIFCCIWKRYKYITHKRTLLFKSYFQSDNR